jgi:hypothetical protein
MPPPAPPATISSSSATARRRPRPPPPRPPAGRNIEKRYDRELREWGTGHLLAPLPTSPTCTGSPRSRRRWGRHLHARIREDPLSSGRVHVFKTFSIFFHNLLIWYHEYLTNFVIFKLHLNLYNFFTVLPYNLHQDRRTKCRKFSLISCTWS